VRKPILVGKGFGKHTFDEAVKMVEAGGVIVFDPGTYTNTDGYNIQNIRMRGDGKQPQDVQINSHFSVAENGKFEVENMQINFTANNNVINVQANGEFIASRTIFNLDTTGDVPTIWNHNGSVTLLSSEVRRNSTDKYEALDGDGGHYLVKQSIVDGIYVLNSYLKVETSQINGKIWLSNEAELEGTDVYFDGTVPTDDSSIKVFDGSKLTTESLILQAERTGVFVTHGFLTSQKSNIQPESKPVMIIGMDEQSEVNVPGAEVTVEAADGEDDQTNSYESAVPYDAETNDDAEPEPTEEPEPVVKAIDQLDGMIGLTKVKEAVHRFMRVAIYNKKREEQGLPSVSQSYHSIYLGNPGTGKTTVARLVARVMHDEGILPNDSYHEVARQDLVAQVVGGTAKQTQKILQDSLGGVLFIDEAYTLYQEGGGTNWGQEAVDTILKFMEDHRNDLMIIFAGYTKEMKDFINMNPGLESRAPNVFDFQDYTPKEISTIGVKQLESKQFKFNQEVYTDAVETAYKSSVENSNGRWVRNFNEQLVQIVANNCIDDPERDVTLILDDDIHELVGGDDNAKADKVQVLLDQLDQLVGLDDVKSYIHDLVERVAVERKLADKLPDSKKPTYHMVFTGSPGTGKTTVARILAQLFYNLGILEKDTVMEVSRADLVGAYIGHTEKKTRTAVRDALGGVLFVDEAYQLTAQNGNDFGKQAVETLITELENNRDKFIAIFAGYTDQMETFLSANPGLRSRIPLTLNFSDYTPDEIAEIVYRRISQNWKIDESLLKHLVANKYQGLPANEQANGRWARNFTDKLISNYKNWLVNHLDRPDLTAIPDEILLEAIR